MRKEVFELVRQHLGGLTFPETHGDCSATSCLSMIGLTYHPLPNLCVVRQCNPLIQSAVCYSAPRSWVSGSSPGPAIQDLSTSVLMPVTVPQAVARSRS